MYGLVKSILEACDTEGFMPHGFLDHTLGRLGPCLSLWLRDELSRPLPHGMSRLRICCDALCSLEEVETTWKQRENHVKPCGNQRDWTGHLDIGQVLPWPCADYQAGHLHQ